MKKRTTAQSQPKPDKPPRQFRTLYWYDARYTRAFGQGFPKAEVGSIEGAAKMIAKGLATKVQCQDRWNNDKPVWTVKAGPRVKGVHIRPIEVFRHDPDSRPTASGQAQSRKPRSSK